MIATNELRKLLNEREVPWWYGDDGEVTSWKSARGITWEFFEEENGMGCLTARMTDVTPMAAVEESLWQEEIMRQAMPYAK